MYFEEALTSLEPERKKWIDQNPIFAKIQDGSFTRWHYLAYLKETYHLVRHTPMYLKVAAERITDNDNWLRDYYLQFAEDETGHELLCVHDIRALEADPEQVLAGKPLGGSWAMITQNYFLSSFGNPVSLIGDTIATEGLGSSLATEMADILEKKYGFPHNATTFLRVHGEADVEHTEAARKAIESFGSERNHYNDILHTWKMTIRYYGQLFSDVLAQGNEWDQATPQCPATV